MERSSERLRAYASAVSRSRWLLLGWMVFWLGAGVAYLAFVKPEFVAKVDVVVEPRKIANDGPEDERHFHQFALDSEQAETELHVLSSERVLRPVFETLHLAETAELASGHNGFWSMVAHELHKFAPNATGYDTETRAYYAFADRVRCLRLGLSYVIEVSYRSQNADRAARVTNAVVASYLAERLARVDAHVERIGGAYSVARERSLARQIEESRVARAEGAPLGRDLYWADARVLGSAVAPLAKSFPKALPALLFALGASAISGVLLILMFRAPSRDPLDEAR